MPSSPRTPRHSRHASSAAPDNIITLQLHQSPSASPIERQRRESRSSFVEPSTPLQHSFSGSGRADSMDMGIFSSGGADGHAEAGAGIGNLADELEGAFSDSGDEEYEDDEEGGEPRAGGAPDINFDHEDDDGATPSQRRQGGGAATTRDSGVDVASPVAGGAEDGAASGGRAKSMSLSLPSTNGGRSGGGSHHKRTPSEYDGSEYGSDSDLESPGMPPSLVARMDAVESLARRGTESGPADGVFRRVTDSLRDLGSQAGVEGGATRLITAHSALTTHLTHQTRQLQNLTFPLFSPLQAPPPPEMIEDLLPLLSSLAQIMPRPSATASTQLANLHAATADLATTLSYLSDSLHMSRQAAATASRRLRSAKDMVAELRRDEQDRDEALRWIARGRWDERLRARECADLCTEVVGGFEEVCKGWRERLLAQAAATGNGEVEA